MARIPEAIREIVRLAARAEHADRALDAKHDINPADGGIQLTFERSDLLDRGADERSYSVLRERKAVKAAMRYAICMRA